MNTIVALKIKARTKLHQIIAVINLRYAYSFVATVSIIELFGLGEKNKDLPIFFTQMQVHLSSKSDVMS